MAKSNAICAHIKEFYARIAGVPIIYCKIDSEQLKKHSNCSEIVLKNTPSDTGDECHYDILNISKSTAKKIPQAFIKQPNLYVCCNGVEIQLTEEQYKSLDELLKDCVYA